MNEQTLLQALIHARGPCGQEDEVRAVCHDAMSGLVDKLSVDPAGNLVGLTKGRGEAPPLRIMVHMDEICLMVKRIEDDGRLRVLPLGGIFPFAFGQGPVEILGDYATISGIMSNGPMHTSSETAHTYKVRPSGSGRGEGKSGEWKDCYVITRKSKNELVEAGVHAGSRVVISRARRNLVEVGDCIAAHYMDNRAAITTALLALHLLKHEKVQPAGDIYTVCTVSEEIGGIGACYAAKELPGEITLAIDVGPVADEYDTKLNDSPIVVYGDAVGIYDPLICRQLLEIGKLTNLPLQTATWENYGSDASIPKKYGQTPRAALVCFPTENTHGFEVIHKNAMSNCAKLVASYLKSYS